MRAPIPSRERRLLLHDASSSELVVSWLGFDSLGGKGDWTCHAGIGVEDVTTIGRRARSVNLGALGLDARLFCVFPSRHGTITGRCLPSPREQLALT